MTEILSVILVIGFPNCSTRQMKCVVKQKQFPLRRIYNQTFGDEVLIERLYPVPRYLYLSEDPGYLHSDNLGTGSSVDTNAKGSLEQAKTTPLGSVIRVPVHHGKASL